MLLFIQHSRLTIGIQSAVAIEYVSASIRASSSSVPTSKNYHKKITIVPAVAPFDLTVAPSSSTIVHFSLTAAVIYVVNDSLIKYVVT